MPDTEVAEKGKSRAQAGVPVPQEKDNPRGRGEPLPYKDGLGFEIF